ncbi:GNAT family N-acetyltransferase [Rhizobium sp. NRK18]|uniref:GNAT family N-acetyltransferase n=1 Tax=Rhizobium sp. NRK18 TaxID=2964667 RepID=UPI0021C4B116|nr:GNAT family N-acetyltransferase [Rhizobium sp. NRK18]MCQ2004232.1 GNAT family N-acetyltransferase [Rhizobium sp. NRK18]
MPAGGSYQVDVRRMEAFSARDLYDLLKLRVDVFVVEQACPYPELDGKDVDALHLRLLDGAQLLAAARLFIPSETETPARIGRVVVSPNHRGRRLGEAVMHEAMKVCETEARGSGIALSAQAHLAGFYASLGFQAVSEEYLEDDIPHIDMLRPAAAAVA